MHSENMHSSTFKDYSGASQIFNLQVLYCTSEDLYKVKSTKKNIMFASKIS